MIFGTIFHACLQVLEGVIKNRWNALPVEQRDGMKNYISEVIVQVKELLIPFFPLEMRNLKILYLLSHFFLFCSLYIHSYVCFLLY